MLKPLNEWAAEIHANAQEHGWWDNGPRSTEEIASLIISEWSEALEEYRADKPMVYYECTRGLGGIDCFGHPSVEEGAICIREADRYCHYRREKPEGIAVELIDGCIRILDYMATVWDAKEPGQYNLIRQFDNEVSNCEVPKLTFLLTKYTIHAYDCDPEKLEHGMLLGIIATVYGWLLAHHIDFEDVLRLKHEYNKTRPYRHGGKKV